MMGGYMDDGRQITTILEKGYRFEETSNSFVFTQEGYKEDIEKERNGESRNEFMGRVCIAAMQSINRDLKFTTESQENALYTNGQECYELPTKDANKFQRIDKETFQHQNRVSKPERDKPDYRAVYTGTKEQWLQAEASKGNSMQWH